MKNTTIKKLLSIFTSLIFGGIITLALTETVLENQYNKTKALAKNFVLNDVNRKPYEPEEYNCSIPKITSLPPIESTAIIGHAYGSASDHTGFLAPSVATFLELNKENLSRVIFTGDVFFQPSLQKWNKLTQKYRSFFDIVVAPGNHDVDFGDNAKRDVFNLSFPKKNKLPYVINNNKSLLIIEDSTTNRWVIGKKVKELVNSSNQYQDIFLFRHHILVKELFNSANVKPASPHELLNIRELLDLLNTKKNITIISGDSGGYGQPRLTCIQFENVTTIANGIFQVEGDSVLVLTKNGELFSIDLKN